MTKLEIYLIVVVAGIILVGVVAFSAYMKGREDGAQSVQTKWDKAVAEQREREEKQIGLASGKLETGNAQAKVVYRTITQTVDKLVEKPVYRNVCLDDDGLRVANQALTGSLAAPPKSDKPVPRPPAADGRQRSVRIAQTH